MLFLKSLSEFFGIMTGLKQDSVSINLVYRLQFVRSDAHRKPLSLFRKALEVLRTGVFAIQKPVSIEARVHGYTKVPERAETLGTSVVERLKNREMQSFVTAHAVMANSA